MTLREITLSLQSHLSRAGHDPGPIDGIYGYNTAYALVEALAVKITDKGYVIDPQPPWYEIALNEVGVKETPGDQHTARILDYHQATTLKADRDEVPWCSSFVCWVMEQAGYISTRSAAARSWLQWGEVIESPSIGAIAVFARGTNPAAGHVGFWAGPGKAATHCRLLSGNINDGVAVDDYPLRRLLGYRWPVAKPTPTITDTGGDNPAALVRALEALADDVLYEFIVESATPDQVNALLRGAVRRVSAALAAIDDPLIKGFIRNSFSDLVRSRD